MPAETGCKKKAAEAAFVRLQPGTVLYRALDIAEFLTEAFDAAGGVDDLLLAGIERMAFGADFDVQRLSAGRTGLEIVAAAARDSNFNIIRVYFCFHHRFLMVGVREGLPGGKGEDYP